MLNLSPVFDLAFEYKSTKFWKKIYDNQLIAVKTKDGEIIYIIVMGKMNTFNGVAVYQGIHSVDYLRHQSRLLKRHDLPLVKSIQNCTLCSFEDISRLSSDAYDSITQYCEARKIKMNKCRLFPNIERYTYGQKPWPVQKECDISAMQTALKALLHISHRCSKERKTLKQLGILRNSTYEGTIACLLETVDGFAWTQLDLPEETLKIFFPAELSKTQLTMLKKMKKKKTSWSVKIMPSLLTVTINENEIEDAYSSPDHPADYIHTIGIINNRTNQLFAHHLAPMNQYVPSFSQFLADTFKKYGIPQTLYYQDEITHVFLEKLAEKLDIKLIERIDDSFEEIEASLAAESERRDSFDDGDDFACDGFDGDVFEDDAMQQRVTQMLSNTLKDPEFLHEVPSEILRQCIQRIEEMSEMNESIPSVFIEIMNCMKKELSTRKD